MKHRGWSGALGIGFALWLAAGGVARIPPAAAEPSVGPGGGAVCADCHDEETAFYDGSPHGGMGAVVPGTASGTCAACHGLTAAHVASEGEQPPAVGVEELAGWTARQRSDACVGCHTDKGQTLEDDPHAGTGVSCWSCHPDQVHAGAGSLRPVSAYRNVSEFCLQCHADVAAAFRLPFHHRVLEAEMSCTDCHPLHGEAPITVVHDDEAGSCLQCHVELNGPFLFPHAGTEELGCTECHRPHGSLHDGLLAQDGNSLCLQCHFEPGFPVIAGTDHALLLRNQARCYDCHTEVHGSDTDPTLRDR